MQACLFTQQSSKTSVTFSNLQNVGVSRNSVRQEKRGETRKFRDFPGCIVPEDVK